MTNDLRVLPFFQPFEDSALHTTNVMLQMSYALRAQLLADAIPALSFAVGANPVDAWNGDGIDNNVNMATNFKNTEMLFCATRHPRPHHNRTTECIPRG